MRSTHESHEDIEIQNEIYMRSTHERHEDNEM
jgi:hypothetical protein